MKKIVVLSDTHGNRADLQKMHNILSEADLILFAGDGANDMLTLPRDILNKVIAVSGNCDLSTFEKERVIDIEDVKVFITHGDLYGVKQGLDKLYYRAKELGADVAIYGHTHLSDITEEDGLLFINPGNLSKYSTNKSFGYLVISGKKTTATINNNFFNLF